MNNPANADQLGYIDNAVIQHGGARAVHGWLKTGEDYQYLCIFGAEKPYLFKILYRFPREDLTDPATATGFVAEIVYGADAITEALEAPPHPTALVLDEHYRATGTAYCEASVFAALDRLKRR